MVFIDGSGKSAKSSMPRPLPLSRKPGERLRAGYTSSLDVICELNV